ncbi:uncharacterized protein LOC143199899 [Rhynchophorus ferrugineus]|uniref:uncharacterized protein LOC143199899 n=1 Tax=Rhynchophorus ferrugineus TaxID=354439 RepID=UPI003FCE6C30
MNQGKTINEIANTTSRYSICVCSSRSSSFIVPDPDNGWEEGGTPSSHNKTENGMPLIVCTGFRGAPFNIQYIKEADTKWSLQFSLKSRKAPVYVYILSVDDMVSINVQPQHKWEFQIYKINFLMRQTYTTDDTKQLSVKQRRCVFQDEYRLKVHNVYTYSACTIQCRMENAKKICGCIPYFYKTLEDFPYCTVQELQCIAKHFEDIKQLDTCNCQLGCDNIIYEVEGQYAETIDNTVDDMEIGFAVWPMLRYKRQVLFGWVDLLVSFGGIAGLFLGFSILSMVEIIYYFVIRSCIAAVLERVKLDRIRLENELKPLPDYDLSLLPYIFSDPLPGGGLDVIARKYAKQLRKTNQRRKDKNMETWAIHTNLFPPFGIEFIN